MILKLAHLDGIRSGKITLAFRKWKKPTVNKGTQIKTEIAVVEITDISEIALDDITKQDSINAGFNSLEDLQNTLNAVNEGRIYKIKLRFYSDDPRIALREQSTIPEKDFQMLKSKLERLDNYSKEGNWTIEVLQAIRDNPELRAADLAIKLKKEKDPLKINIRKLKNLGLTVSHDVGYSLSPLGEFVLKRLLSNI